MLDSMWGHKWGWHFRESHVYLARLEGEPRLFLFERGGSMQKAILFLASVAAVVGPTASAQQHDSTDFVRSAVFAPALHIDLDSAQRLNSGAYVLDLSTGTGPVVSGGRPITMQFAAWLPSGNPASRADTSPRTYSLGKGFFTPCRRAGNRRYEGSVDADV